MKEVSVLLLGIGSVGGCLLQQIVQSRNSLVRNYGLSLRVAGLVDSRAALEAPAGGWSDEELLQIRKPRGESGTLRNRPGSFPREELPQWVNAHPSPLLLADCSASPHTTPLLLEALEQRGCGIVLANKLPLTQEQEVFERLTRLAPSRVRWEATVCSGLPVITTLQRLLRGGDRVKRISGSFSSTLGFLTAGLERGRRLNEGLSEAVRLGYAEPDPRQDLSGRDVACKCLILARTQGLRLDLEEVKREGLIPDEWLGWEGERFWQEIPARDRELQEKLEQARARGEVLRFVGSVEEGSCRVGPRWVPRETPLGRLQGSQQLVEFYTRWYRDQPLLVQGRGSGAEATAAAVLCDLVEVASSLD